VGGWKAPALLNVPVLTDALVETAIPHLVGGRACDKWNWTT